MVDKKLLNNMLTDDNPQRLSRVMKTVDKALELQFEGKSVNEIKQILKKSFEGPSSPTSAKLIEDTVPGSISQARLTFLENKVQKGGNITPEEIKEIKQLSEIYGGNFASGGRVPLAGGLLAKGIGKFSKSEVLIKMMENTLKGSKDAYVKKTFPNFIKELKANPELANDPKVWGHFTTGLPKNQRLVVHSDDTVDFWTQSDFGPHNIETTNKFIQKHPNLSRDEAVRIQNMEPEDQILEMKRLETIRNRTKNASGGRVSLSAGGLAGILGE